MSVQITRKELVFAFWARKDSTGVYPYGATGTISTGAGAMMQRAKGFTAFDVSKPASPTKTLIADGGIMDSYKTQPTEVVTGTIGTLVLDTSLASEIGDLNLYTEGEHEILIDSNSCLEFPNICLVLNYRADSYNSSTGVWTRNIWWVEEYMSVTAEALTPSASADPSADPSTWQYSLTINDAATTFAGETITSVNYGRAKGFSRKYKSANPVIWGTYVGNNSTTVYAIPAAYDPVAEAATAIQVWDDGTEQTYTTNFTLSGQNLTFGSAPASGSIHPFKLEFDGSAC